MQLTWQDETRPFSDAFQDIYYAEEDGLAESRYVFLQQNGFPERFSQQTTTVIGELGFGTGLNFLASWKMWKQSPKSDQHRLHFVSFEKFPLSTEQVNRALSRWPELDLERKEFTKIYQTLPPGFFRFEFEQARVLLTLVIGDARDTLPRFVGSVNAWFLDGFAPRKNPEIWSLEVMQKLAERSTQATTFSTYTSAGWIRRNMEAAGFRVEKFKGFGRKRDMLRGSSAHSARNSVHHKASETLVIGAGLAGMSIAHSLAKRGEAVTILDQDSFPLPFSRLPKIAMTLPAITSQPTSLGDFSMAGFVYNSNLFASAPCRKNSSGLLFLNVKSERFDKLRNGIHNQNLPPQMFELLPPSSASDVAGLRLDQEAVFIKQGGWIDFQDLSKYQMRKGITLKTNCDVASIEYSSDLWQAKTEKGDLLASAPRLVLANAWGLKKTPLTNWIPVRKVRGQACAISSTAQLQNLKCVLCFDGFVTPPFSYFLSCHVLGATYDHNSDSLQVRPEENFELIRRMQSAVPSLASESPRILASHVGWRTSVPGQEPLLGRLCTHSGEELPNAYVLSALSSRGSIYAPLGGEILASLIHEEPIPLSEDLLNALSPTRFARISD